MTTSVKGEERPTLEVALRRLGVERDPGHCGEGAVERMERDRHNEAVDVVLDELERLRLSCKGVEGWREIESAPKGENVLVAAGSLVGEAYFNVDPDKEDGGEWWWANQGPGDYYADPIIYGGPAPTLWQPLPAAPVSPSPLMDFGASQVRHQPSAATPDGDPTQVKP